MDAYFQFAIWPECRTKYGLLKCVSAAHIRAPLSAIFMFGKSETESDSPDKKDERIELYRFVCRGRSQSPDKIY